MHLRPSAILLLLSIVFLVAASGCINIESPSPTVVPPQGVTSTTATELPSPTPMFTQGEPNEIMTGDQIDAALTYGPVLLDFERGGTVSSQNEVPVIQQIAKNYQNLTVLTVDADDSPALRNQFGVNGVPHIDVIVSGSADKGYTYVSTNGSLTTDLSSADRIGPTDYDVLQPQVEKALRARHLLS